eukprot:CAMPEP_0175311544 /NCGR_PEP_ID=MMETSP0093-20121207/66896_1 /TAXON_ID=311494 /ORGANISM="Alexandrium monilatum, Strain CCMP3105" /LENGTH=72 /DNA_ID=CAMNT_0016608169 /DNA_START=4 /DNA_END=218 /DNA_ORIENTATION=-
MTAVADDRLGDALGWGLCGVSCIDASLSKEPRLKLASISLCAELRGFGGTAPWPSCTSPAPLPPLMTTTGER